MRRIPTVAVLLAFAPTIVLAQSPLRSAPSTRGTVEVSLAPARVEGQPAPTPTTIKIDYGQPHARGRTVAGALAADMDSVWRLGANAPTTLTTGADLVIGGAAVPKGTYTLYAQTSARGAWQLVINKSPGQTYAKDQDHARVPLTASTLAVPLESLSFWLIPAGDGSPSGELRLGWGSRAFSTTWSVR